MPNKRKKRENSSAGQSQQLDEAMERIAQKAKTSLRRTSKLVRSFHCQKAVRKLKQLKEQQRKKTSSADLKLNTPTTVINEIDEKSTSDEKLSTSNHEGDSKCDDKHTSLDRKTRDLEQKMEQMKNFDLDKLVFVGIQRIGLSKYCSFFPDESSGIDRKNKTSTSSHDASEDPTNERRVDCYDFSSFTKFEKDFIESMLLHKRCTECMETIQESISSHRASQIRREERREEKHFRKKRKLDQKHVKEQHQNESRQHEQLHNKNDYAGSSGVFIESLSGNAAMNSGYEENYDETGVYSGNDYSSKYSQELESSIKPGSNSKRKNRMGQRARKAKALAIKARKEGKTWDKSLNWRPKKENNDDDENNTSKRKNVEKSIIKKGNDVKASEVANNGENWKDNGTAHPSWLAAQRQKKEGIVAFAGKKITFD